MLRRHFSSTSLSGAGERPRRRLAHLAAMTQIMIGDHARYHGLADRHRADADAGVVAPLGADLGLGPVTIDGASRGEDRRGRLDHEAADDRLPRGNAAENAAGMVGQKHRLAVVAHAHLVGIVLAAERRRRKAGADLDALDGIDAHQRGGEIAVELAVDRRAEAGGNTLRDDLDDGADGGAALADVVEIRLEAPGLLGIGTEERVAVDLVPVPARTV